MNRRGILFLILVVVLSFKAGVAFDRWLHRPIAAAGWTVAMPTTTVSDEVPAPLIDMPVPCYSDKPREDCPAAPEEPPPPPLIDAQSPKTWDELPDFGTWPPGREVCTAVNTICWQRT